MTRSPAGADPPDGLQVRREADGTRHISWRGRRSVVALVFLGVWLAGWTVGCVALLHGYFTGGRMDDGQPIPFWFVAIFWAAEFLVAGVLLMMLFQRYALRLDLRGLSVRDGQPLGGPRTIARSRIRGLELEFQEGQGDATAWSLKSGSDYIVKNQSYERVHWIGTQLAEWLGVELVVFP